MQSRLLMFILGLCLICPFTASAENTVTLCIDTQNATSVALALPTNGVCPPSFSQIHIMTSEQPTGDLGAVIQLDGTLIQNSDFYVPALQSPAQSVPFVASVSRSETQSAEYIVNFTPDIFTEAPMCTVTALSDTTTLGEVNATVVSVTATQLVYRTFEAGLVNITLNPQLLAAQIVCHGTTADHIGS